MKIYRAADTVAPLRVDLQSSPEPVSGTWITALMLFAGAVLLVMPHSPFAGDSITGSPFASRVIVAGFALALVLVGVAILSRAVPALARFGNRHRLGVIIAFVVAITLTFGPLALLAIVPGARPIGLLFLLGFVINFAVFPLWFVERRNARRIAAEMRAAAQHGATPVPPPAKSEPARPGELVIGLYETGDLPTAVPLREQVTVQANILDQPPCRLLFLYNFFASELSSRPRPVSGWRLHGPVAMLASPLELARAAGYAPDLSRAVESRLLAEPSAIDERVAGLSDLPLPPRPLSYLDRLRRKLPLRQPASALPDAFADSGAYPEEVLLCTDQTWQQGVHALTRRAAKAIMDASDFSSERRGLIWEIQHLVDHFAAPDFVVLVNSFTDLPALAAEFRRAWANMSPASPNNRPAESHLRIVLLIGDDRGGFDDDSSMGGRSSQIRDYERIAAHHRIMALLRSSAAPDLRDTPRLSVATP